jgi:putative intracellular protease/amidase
VEGVDLKASAMTNRSPNAVRGLVALRRLARRLYGVGLSAAWLVGVGAAGAVVSMREAYPRAPQAAPAESWPPATPVPEGRLAVAVVLGASGSVITDAFGPYEVFACSPIFSVYTVSASRPNAMLSGGLAVVPDYSLDDVDAGVAPEPDVVVVPAVAAPAGKKEAPLREWITRWVDRGAHLLGVCNGSRLLAATGLLDGRQATAHWSSVGGLERSRPQVEWVRGQRYVQDGTLTTTAGVTSGVWLRPTVGVGLVEGVGELEVAASFEVYASSFTARTVPIAAEATVTTRHGLRLVATPANAGPLMLGDLAGHSDQTTARVTAKSLEYPTEQLELAGAGWPWRPTALFALTVTAAIGVALVPAAATRRNRR